MILLCNGDSWTSGDRPAQEVNWEAKPNLDWYNIVPGFGQPTLLCRDKILYKFYDSSVWPKVLGEKLGCETWNCGKLGISNDRLFRTTINYCVFRIFREKKYFCCSWVNFNIEV